MGHHSVIQNTSVRQPHTLPHINTVKHIGIALFDGFALHEAASIVEVFQSANALAEMGKPGATRYSVRLLSAAGGKVTSSSSVFVCTESIDARRQADKLHALFIAGGEGLHSSLHDIRLISWLREALPSNKHIYPGPGAHLLLEAAGVTQSVTGRKCVDSSDDVRRKLPGAMASPCPTNPLQLALGVIKDDLGPQIAHQIAALTQPLAETPFTTTVRKNTSAHLSEQIQAAAQWLESHSDQPISIGDAARVAAMSERNFLRRFKIEMGQSPSDYLLKVRLDASCRLLIETTLPVDKIARRCGIGDGGRLSKLFRNNLATTPTKYRANHRSTRISS